MKTFAAILAVIVVGFGAIYLLGSDFELKDSGALPEVDVSADGGRLPDVDVKTPEVEVKSNTAKVDVPDVDVKMEEKAIEYPTVDFNAAEDSAIDEAAEPDAKENE